MEVRATWSTPQTSVLQRVRGNGFSPLDVFGVSRVGCSRVLWTVVASS